jgi:hypothetical protein
MLYQYLLFHNLVSASYIYFTSGEYTHDMDDNEKSKIPKTINDPLERLEGIECFKTPPNALICTGYEPKELFNLNVISSFNEDIQTTDYNSLYRQSEASIQNKELNFEDQIHDSVFNTDFLAVNPQLLNYNQLKLLRRGVLIAIAH